MTTPILDEIHKNIQEISGYYKLDNIKKINSENIKTLTNNFIKNGEKDLNTLNYRIGSIEKKKKEKTEIRQLGKELKGKGKTHIISIIDSKDVEKLDNYSKPWNKLDNWQKKKKIEEYVKKYLKNDNQVLNKLFELIKKGGLKKKSRDLIYDPDNQEITHLNLKELGIVE